MSRPRRFRPSRLALLIQASACSLYLFGAPSRAQTDAPLSYIVAGEDGTCCSSGIHPNNGHDGKPAPHAFTQTDSNKNINATGANQAGIYIQVSGGNGGDGLQDLERNHWGGNGGNAAAIDYTLKDSTVVSAQRGINVLSAGGRGGNWANATGPYGGYGIGGAADNVALTLSQVAVTGLGFGVALQSIGGNGARSALPNFDGASDAGNGGRAGDIRLDLLNFSSVTASGPGPDDVSAAIGFYSGGGDGGTGDHTGVGGHSNAGNGGDSGTLTFVSSAGSTVTALGDGVYGIALRTLGGNASQENTVDVRAGHGGNAGSIFVSSGADITTNGNRGIGIYALSEGGYGGNGGNGSWAGGHDGGDGGTAGLINISNLGFISTGSASTVGAKGIVASAWGGAGGPGGESGTFGHGGNGAPGGSVDGAIVISNVGVIDTAGNDAAGVVANSIGGGGGNGGESVGVIFVGGGHGGNGGDGGSVRMDNSIGAIRTLGDNSPGAVLQSIGGGGGYGGDAEATGVIASIAIGGSGGGAGNGGVVSFHNDASIITQGGNSSGVVLQSIGGGGGSAGSATAVGVGVGLNVTVALGGKGGTGGSGGDVSFDQTLMGFITTAGAQSMGVLAQSVGGGGNGGLANSRVITIAPPTGEDPSGTVTLAVTNGGQGAGAGNGGNITISSLGSITTQGAQSHGIVAQSTGGGGGNGGGVLAALKSPTIGPSLVDLQLSVRNGGNGGEGGNGGAVTVSNGGSVTTAGSGAAGIVAQSTGGGGGTSGLVQSHDLNSFTDIVGSPTLLPGLLKTALSWLEQGPELAISKTVNVSLALTNGGSGGAGGSGGLFSVSNSGSVSTAGDHAPGILAQSIGGGGGNAAAIESSGASSLLSSIDALINAAVSAPGNLLSLGLPQTNISHQVGGDGGAGGSGAGTDATPATITNSGTVATSGNSSAAIAAQSVGGGGGRSSTSSQDIKSLIAAASGSQAQTVLDDLTAALNLLASKGLSALGAVVQQQVGGSNGASGTGGSVLVDASAASSKVSTAGWQSPALFAQSVGGGGGVSAIEQALYFSGQTSSTITLGNSGTLRAGQSDSKGGSATVRNGGHVFTAGAGSAGILAQSVGGGGGLVTLGLHNAFDSTMVQTASSTITLGGELGWAQNSGSDHATVSGGNATVVNSGSIVTQGAQSHGVMAQSVGGGGGMALLSSTATQSDLDLQLGSTKPASGTPAADPAQGGAVNVTNQAGTTATTGDLSFGVLAQSVGGGGGYIDTDGAALNAASNITFGASGPNSGAGGAVSVTQDGQGLIQTSGRGSHGIVAQSVGGGGGIAGLATEAGTVTLKAAQTAQQDSNSDGGTVTVSASGQVQTRGDGAIGILAQSIGGGGGISGDSAAGAYGTVQQAGLAGGQGNGGAVTVDVGASARIGTAGANAPAILAMSVGGGGVLKDGVLYQYGVAGSEAATGGPVTINLSNDATVITMAANTATLVAISSGNAGGGSADITLAGGSLLAANQQNGTAILTSAAKTTITNSGTIVAATAISTSDASTVINHGVLSGNVLMGADSSFSNSASGSLMSGTQFQGDLNNAGLFNPGGVGRFTTTRIEGGFVNTGVYSADLDFGQHNSDFINVSGPASFGGTLQLHVQNPVKNVWLGLGHFDGEQTSIPTIDNKSPIYSFELRNNNSSGWRDPLISINGNFVTSELASDHAGIARALQGLWDQGDASTGALFGKLTSVQSAADYRQALNRIAHDGQFARAANQMQASYASIGRMMSCPGFIGESSLLRENDCVWTRIDGRWTRRDSTADDEGYRIRETTLTVGGQHEFRPNWFVGGSVNYSSGRTTASGLRADSDTYAGGLVLKYSNAPWQFSAAMHGGVDKSRMSRDTLDGVARSKPESSFIAGRLRAAYEFSQPGWYLRPYADLDVNHIRQKRYAETGSDLFNLTVSGNSSTSHMLSPMLEIGGRRDLANGATLRGYVAGGASFLRDGDVVSTVRLSNFDAAPFSLRSGMPKTYANVAAGVEYVSKKGVELKTEYSLRANGQYRDQVLTLRAAYRF